MNFFIVEYGYDKHEKKYNSTQIYLATSGPFDALVKNLNQSLDNGSISCFRVTEYKYSPENLEIFPVQTSENDKLKPKDFRILNAPTVPSSRKEAQWKKETKHKSAFI